MGRVFIDGFENGNLDLWTTVGEYALVAQGIPGMSGAYCLNLATGSAPVSNLGLSFTAGSDFYLAFKYRRTLTTQNCAILALYKGGTSIGGLKIPIGTNAGKLVAYIGSQYNENAIGQTFIDANVTYLIEFRYKLADAGGIIQVKLNGSLEIDFTGDTKPGSDTTIDYLTLGQLGSFNSNAYFDDFVLDNASWIGNTQIQGLVASENGSLIQWTPSVGSNWSCVEEIPKNDADYVSTNTDGQLDLYSFSDLQGAIESVKSLIVSARALKEGSPVPQKLQVALRSGGGNYFCPGKVLQIASPKSVCHLWETDPATGLPWQTSGVNNGEFGIKAVVS